MKNLLKLLCLILVAFFSQSCESGLEETNHESTSEVSFTAAMMTRASDTAFESGDEISVTAYATDGTTFAENISYTYSGSLFTSSTPITYTSADQQLLYRAIYPYVAMDDTKVVNFTVKTDQSSGSNYTLSDLMASYTNFTASATPQLDFYHLLTKVVVNITSSDVDMMNVVASVNALASVEYNIGTLTSASTGSATSIIMASNGVNSYKAIIAPQSISSAESFGSISVNGTSYDFGYTVDVDMAAGKEYTINATIINGEITFDNPIINDWDEGEYPDVEVADGYILIRSGEQLAMIGNDDSYPLDGSYKLMSDIDLSAYSNWTPIGDPYFTGVFDGGGCTISNLMVQDSTDSRGLFCCVEGTIRNLTLKNPVVVGTSQTGAVCGFISGTLENCGVEGGSVTATSDDYVGGVVGMARSAIVTSCYNVGCTVSGVSNVGGVVGSTYAYEGFEYITSCYNTGYVSGGVYVGGVVGCTTVPLEDCYNTGYVTATGNFSGGVAGRHTSTAGSSYITKCYNRGEVNGTSYTGGVAGGACAVSQCYNEGVVVADSCNYVGGVVGCCYYSISQCYNKAAVIGGERVGGVYGGNYTSSDFTISSCYNVGSVSASSRYAGGVIGYGSVSGDYTITMLGCYNTGAINCTGSLVGGVAGYLIGDLTSCYFIDQADDNATQGIGTYSSSDYDYMILSSVLALNNVVSDMNTAAGGTYFAAGNPTSTNLPSLMGENLAY